SEQLLSCLPALVRSLARPISQPVARSLSRRRVSDLRRSPHAGARRTGMHVSSLRLLFAEARGFGIDLRFCARLPDVAVHLQTGNQLDVARAATHRCDRGTFLPIRRREVLPLASELIACLMLGIDTALRAIVDRWVGGRRVAAHAFDIEFR